eukprot:TRINITY_DN74350_c0_g1_i1.p1 TRINITY_DN74350_c0_g1~~TRINITY_DN74350_c0_g1_i1.p1  ORF type:complete len:153 (-),score=28.62 TRINITY_DN74350_c0_g1_i1:11-430(-)
MHEGSVLITMRLPKSGSACDAALKRNFKHSVRGPCIMSWGSAVFHVLVKHQASFVPPSSILPAVKLASAALSLAPAAKALAAKALAPVALSLVPAVLPLAPVALALAPALDPVLVGRQSEQLSEVASQTVLPFCLETMD